ncbi:hypothetical protein H4S02_005299, partial [Coemansia sp. RSA 2611]
VDGHKYAYMVIATCQCFLSHAGICFKDTYPFRALNDFPSLARLFSRFSGLSASFPVSLGSDGIKNAEMRNLAQFDDLVHPTDETDAATCGSISVDNSGARSSDLESERDHMTVEPTLDLAPVWILEQVDEEDAARSAASGADNPQVGSLECSDCLDHSDRVVDKEDSLDFDHMFQTVRTQCASAQWSQQCNRQIIDEEREDIGTWLGTANPAIVGPDSYRNAMHSAEAPKWKEAVMVELESIDNND